MAPTSDRTACPMPRTPTAVITAALALVAGSFVVPSVLTVATGAAAASAPSRAASVGSAGAVAASTSGLVLGAASYAASTAHSPAKGIASLEAALGRTLGVDRSYSQWDDVQPSAAVGRDIAAGRLPLLSIRPQLRSGTKLSWSSVADGSRDDTIRAQAKGLRSVAHPVLLAFHHEADLQSGYGAAADFRAAFRHYVAVFRASGATKVAFAVVLAGATYGSAIDSWYPGDDVVDWLGADSYNFAACSPGRPAWRSFDKATSAFHRWGAARHKPMLLAEWGSAEDVNQPGRKAEWINDAARIMSAWPELKVASYFDQAGSCNWRLDSSASSWQAFKDFALSPLANGTPPPVR